MPLLKSAGPTPDTIALHEINLRLPERPDVGWSRDVIDNADDRAARAERRKKELDRYVDREHRASILAEHEEQDRKLAERIAWHERSSTGRMIYALCGDGVLRLAFGDRARWQWWCPSCQVDSIRAFRSDEDITEDQLGEERLVVEHHYGRVPDGSAHRMRMACVGGCSADALHDATRAIVVEIEQELARKVQRERRDNVRAELKPSTVSAPTMLVPKLVPDHALTIINGPTGTAKSWLAEAIAVTITSGQPLLGDKPTRTGRVLLVLLEAFAINYARLPYLTRGMGLVDTPDEIDIWPAGVGFKTHEPSDMAKLAAYYRASGPYAAIIFDNLTEIRGGTSQNAENDSTIISNALRPLAQLAHDGTINGERITDQPPAVIVLHHDRGSSAIGQHADLMLRLVRNAQTPEAPVTIKLGEGCRLAVKGLPLTMRFRGIAPDPIVPELVTKKDASEQTEQPADDLTGRERAALVFLAENPGSSANEIRRTVGGSHRDNGPMLRGLEARAYIEQREGVWFLVDDEE